MEKFKQDLEVGQKAEEEVATILESRGWNITYNNSADLKTLRGWDLKGIKDSKTIYVEVKNDLKASTTGNVAIEVRCVEHSLSNIWVYKINNEFWAVNFAWLRTEIATDGRYVNGGDNNNSFMKLVPVDVFKNNAKKL